jgi:hypothetical protein
MERTNQQDSGGGIKGTVGDLPRGCPSDEATVERQENKVVVMAAAWGAVSTHHEDRSQASPSHRHKPMQD